MRLFYAIEFPGQVKERLKTASAELMAASAGGRWPRPENIHLTLQFLGECKTGWLPELEAVLCDAAAGCPPFDLEISGCGTFGSRQEVLWLGAGPSAPLQTLAGRLKERLIHQNMPYEERPFSPHVTLARQVQIDPLFLKSWRFSPVTFRVDEICLMESRVDGQRRVYTALARALLKDGAT